MLYSKQQKTQFVQNDPQRSNDEIIQFVGRHHQKIDKNYMLFLF